MGYKEVKVRIFPGNFRKHIINKTLKCVMQVWNRNVTCYKNNTPCPDYMEIYKDMVKKDFRCKDVSEFALKEEEVSFRAYLDSVKSNNGDFIPEKTKNDNFISYKLHGSKIKLKGNKIKLHKIGWVKFSGKLPEDCGKPELVTINRVSPKEYYAYLLISDDKNV